MVQTKTLTKWIREKLNAISSNFDPKYTFSVSTEVKNISGSMSATKVEGRLHKSTSSNITNAGFNSSMAEYSLDLFVACPKGTNGYLLEVSKIIDDFVAAENGKYNDMDNGRVLLVFDDSIAQNYLEKYNGCDDFAVLTLRFSAQWTPNVIEDTEEIKEGQIEIKLINRTPYHNRRIDMNEEDKVVLKLNTTVVGWTHDEVSAVLKVKLPATFVAEYTYAQITEFNGRVTRWFVLGRQYDEPQVWTLTLKRDVIRENWNELQDSTFFVERGYVNETDPAIFNPETIVGNKLLQERHSLTSPKYIALFYNLNNNALTCNTHILTKVPEALPIVNVNTTNKIKIYSNSEPRFLVKKYGYGFLWLQYDHGLCTASGVDYNDFDDELWAAFTNKNNHSNPDQLAREYFNWLVNRPEMKNISLQKMGGEIVINNDYNMYNGKKFFVKGTDNNVYQAEISNETLQHRDDIFYHAKPYPQNGTYPEYDEWLANADEQFSASIEWKSRGDNNGATKEYKAYRIRTYWKEWNVNFTKMTTTSGDQMLTPIQLDMPALNSQFTNNAFGYNILIGKINNGTLYPTATRDAIIAFANSYNNAISDIQIIPFDFDITNNIVDISSKIEVKNVRANENSVIDEIYVLKDANIQTFIEYEQKQKLFDHNKKTSSIFDTMKIVCPNNSGEVEFCPKHITDKRNIRFAVKGTLSPLPYYSVTPISDGTGLYPYGEVKDLRLVLGGNFSVTQSTDAWANYVANNKYYNEIWAKQQTSNDFNFQQQQQAQRFNYNLGLVNSVISSVSNIGINAGMGNAAGVTSGLVSSTTGLIGQIASSNQAFANAEKSYNMNKQTQAELRDLQLATIRSQPNTIRKVGGGNIDNYFSIMLEVYSDYDGQINQLMKNFDYIGYNISRVMKLDPTVLQFPITAKLQESGIDSENMVVAINNELQQSIKIIPIKEYSVIENTISI